MTYWPAVVGVSVLILSCGGNTTSKVAQPKVTVAPIDTSEQPPQSTDPPPQTGDIPPPSYESPVGQGDQPEGGSTASSQSGCVAALLQASSSSAKCTSCVESICATSLTTAESACGSELACICPGGVYDPSKANSNACDAAQGSTCASALTSLGNCSQKSCADACSVTICFGPDGGTCLSETPGAG